MSHEMPTLEATVQPTARETFSAIAAECDPHQQRVEETMSRIQEVAMDFATSMREAGMPMDTIRVERDSKESTPAWIVVEHRDLSGKPLESATTTRRDVGYSLRGGHPVALPEETKKLSLKEIASLAERKPKPWPCSSSSDRISYHANAVGITAEGELILLYKDYRGRLDNDDGLSWVNARYTRSNRPIAPADLFRVEGNVYSAALLTVFTTRLTEKAEELATKKKIAAARPVPVAPTPTLVVNNPVAVNEKSANTSIIQRDFRLKPAETLFPNRTLNQMMYINLFGRLGVGAAMEVLLFTHGDVGQNNTVTRLGFAAGILLAATKGRSNDRSNIRKREDLLERNAEAARDLAACNRSSAAVEALNITQQHITLDIARTELPEALGVDDEKLPTQDIINHLQTYAHEAPGMTVKLRSEEQTPTAIGTDTEADTQPIYTMDLNPFEALRGIVKEAGDEAGIFVSAMYTETNTIRDAQLRVVSLEAQLSSAPKLPEDAGPKMTTAHQKLLQELAEAKQAQEMDITRSVLNIYSAWLSHRQQTFEQTMSIAMEGPSTEARLTGGHTQALREAALEDLRDFLVQSRGSSSITPKEDMDKATTLLAAIPTYEVANV